MIKPLFLFTSILLLVGCGDGTDTTRSGSNSVTNVSYMLDAPGVDPVVIEFEPETLDNTVCIVIKRGYNWGAIHCQEKYL